MVWLRKEAVLERYTKEDNPIKIWSVLVYLLGGVGAVFLSAGIAMRLLKEDGPDMVFIVLGGLLLLLAAVVLGCSVWEYLSVRRRIMEDDFRSVKVTCTNLRVSKKALGNGNLKRTVLELWLEDQKGNVHYRYLASPSPELLEMEKGSVHYLVGIKKNKVWRLFQLYPADEWRLDW